MTETEKWPRCNTFAYIVSAASRTRSFLLRNNKFRTDSWPIALGKEEDNSNTPNVQLLVSNNFHIPLLRKIAK